MDLTGASLDLDALKSAHWSGAIGLQPQAQSHASMHNLGVTATKANRWKEVEGLFRLVILKQPEIAESWVARGITRERASTDIETMRRNIDIPTKANDNS